MLSHFERTFINKIFYLKICIAIGSLKVKNKFDLFSQNYFAYLSKFLGLHQQLKANQMIQKQLLILRAKKFNIEYVKTFYYNEFLALNFIQGHRKFRYDDRRNLLKYCEIGPRLSESEHDSFIEITIAAIFCIFAILVFSDHF